MDRLMSNDERIRRAEEVAERRKNAPIDLDNNRKNTSEYAGKTKVIFFQAIVCILLYGGFYYVKSLPEKPEQLQVYFEKIRDVLNYDVDLSQTYNFFFQNNNGTQKSIDNEETKNPENISGIESSISDTDSNENWGVGGELIEEPGSSGEEQPEPNDATYITNKIALENPLSSGVVTSKFGAREPSKIVSANHKGIDIGAPTGTSIVSACDGKVIQVSSSGDLGKHIKLQNDDLTFIYAHCSKLLVNEGDNIVRGQKIAEVGSSGRATGPHLHFEIRRGERSIDPSLVINFE